MKESAGLLLYRRHHGDLEVLLGHPGGPFWRGKEEGAWTIPKGLIAPDETALAAAQPEFAEETGYQPLGDPLPLGKRTSTATCSRWSGRQDRSGA